MRLQLSHADARINNRSKNLHSINPNGINESIFFEYMFLLLIMDANHGLFLNNRKYYYNSIAEKFEPIYYDGNAGFKKLNTHRINQAKQLFEKSSISEINPNFIKNIIKIVNSEELKEKFVSYANILDPNSSNFYEKAVMNLISNMNILKNTAHKSFKLNKRIVPHGAVIDTYLDSIEENPISQKTIKKLELSSNKYIATFQSGLKKKLNVNDVGEIITNNRLNGERTVFMGDYVGMLHEVKSIKDTEDIAEKITVSIGVGVKIIPSQKIITFTQNRQDDWVLIQSADLMNWKIKFNGLKQTPNHKSSTNQRFNSHGLTGCLTFYESEFQNTSIEVDGGVCEDSLNIISSKGSISSIMIKDAYADAIDIDFSLIKISDVNIKKSGNDCVDVSGGIYTLDTVIISDCGDKGISVGEGSTLLAKNIEMNKVKIGVSSKDLSEVKILNTHFKDVEVCIEVKQKKQEFGGAYLLIESLKCNGTFIVDEHSGYEIGLH